MYDEEEIPEFKPYTLDGFYYDGSESAVWEAQEHLEELVADGASQEELAKARTHYARCRRAWQHSLL